MLREVEWADRNDVLVLLIGIGTATLGFLFEGLLYPVVGISFAIGAVLQVLAKRFASSRRTHLVFLLSKWAVPGLLLAVYGLLLGDGFGLAMGAFFLSCAVLLLLQAVTSVDTRRFDPVLFGAMAVCFFLLDYLLAALALLGFTAFTAFRASKIRGSTG